MRLWSLHPRYLDAKGLVALWREGLLARAVLLGRTRGYTRHPQLERFRAHAAPALAIDAYLAAVHDEAAARGYQFDRAKLDGIEAVEPIIVTRGQLACEWAHLMAKLALRCPERHLELRDLRAFDCHPLLRAVDGPVAAWERALPAKT